MLTSKDIMNMELWKFTFAGIMIIFVNIEQLQWICQMPYWIIRLTRNKDNDNKAKEKNNNNNINN